MQRSPLEAVKVYYASLLPGQRAELMEVLAPDLVLEVPDGFPGGGGTFRGLKAYLEEFLYQFYGSFDLETTADEFLASGDRVVALGWHRGRAIATGNPVQVRFAHVWTVRGGRLASGVMVTDTAALCVASDPTALGRKA